LYLSLERGSSDCGAPGGAPNTFHPIEPPGSEGQPQRSCSLRRTSRQEAQPVAIPEVERAWWSQVTSVSATEFTRLGGRTQAESPKRGLAAPGFLAWVPNPPQVFSPGSRTQAGFVAWGPSPGGGRGSGSPHLSALVPRFRRLDESSRAQIRCAARHLTIPLGLLPNPRLAPPSFLVHRFQGIDALDWAK
jgi:hypothetical protein